MSMTSLDSQEVQRRVVAMYERHPFPAYTDKFRKTAEEMSLKMRLLGLDEADYTGKQILDCGCGTGEFTCWYAARGNEVTGVDLCQPSIDAAQAYARGYGLDGRIRFTCQSVLELGVEPESYDIVYSYGVLHHTADPQRGFANMVRACKPGGVVIVSLYSLYSRWIHRFRQRLINRLAGDDIEARCGWGRRLFPLTARKLKLRAHDDSDAVLYDQFSQPHESLHTVEEVLGWLDAHGLTYLGSFGPLRLRDYLYAASLPEYASIERTFDGYLLPRMASRLLKTAARVAGMQPRDPRTFAFPRPGPVSRKAVQLGWAALGLRFSCFSIAGRKPHRQEGSAR